MATELKRWWGKHHKWLHKEHPTLHKVIWRRLPHDKQGNVHWKLVQRDSTTLRKVVSRILFAKYQRHLGYEYRLGKQGIWHRKRFVEATCRDAAGNDSPCDKAVRLGVQAVNNACVGDEHELMRPGFCKYADKVAVQMDRFELVSLPGQPPRLQTTTASTTTVPRHHSHLAAIPEAARHRCRWSINSVIHYCAKLSPGTFGPEAYVNGKHHVVQKVPTSRMSWSQLKQHIVTLRGAKRVRRFSMVAKDGGAHIACDAPVRLDKVGPAAATTQVQCNIALHKLHATRSQKCPPGLVAGVAVGTSFSTTEVSKKHAAHFGFNPRMVFQAGAVRAPIVITQGPPQQEKGGAWALERETFFSMDHTAAHSATSHNKGPEARQDAIIQELEEDFVGTNSGVARRNNGSAAWSTILLVVVAVLLHAQHAAVVL